MKRILIIGIVIILIFAIGVTSYNLFIETKKYEISKTPRFALEIFGNANMDEIIDEKDIIYLQRIIRGEVNATQFADANKDGKIDEKDIEQVRAIINGNASYIWMLDGNSDLIKVKLPVKRIGVEYLSNIELMRILGVQDKIIAVDIAPYMLREFYLPERANEIINLGNMYKPDYEYILSLNLDTIFTFSFDISEKKSKLQDINVVFLGLYWPDVINVNESRFIQGIMKAGYILGKIDRAKEYLNWLLNTMDYIKNKTSTIPENKKPSVLMTARLGYLVDPLQKNLRTYTYIDPLSQMCILAGGRPIAMDLPDWLGKSYYTTIDLEWVLEKNPEYIFVHTVRYTYNGRTLPPAYGYNVDDITSLNSTWFDIMSRPLLQNINAVKNNRVYIIAGDFRNNAMGSILGAVYLAKILHPELFEDLDPRAIHQEYITKWMGLNYNLTKHGTFLYPPIIENGKVIGIPQP